MVGNSTETTLFQHSLLSLSSIRSHESRQKKVCLNELSFYLEELDLLYTVSGKVQ